MVQYAREREFLFQAAASPCGIVLATANWQLDMQALISARRAEREFLPPLEIIRSPWAPQSEIWIVKVAPKAKAELRAERRSAEEASEGPPPPAVGEIDITLDDLDL